MTAEVDICNLALSHLGDAATVASISPPEGSAQAQHCAVFYPMARNSLLELHDWGFATARVKPSLKQEQRCGWRYAYAAPADLVRIISLKPAPLCKDESSPSVPFQTELGKGGGTLILCDHADVMLRYTTLVTDSNRFTPLFVATLSWYLASMLAGPILKGDAGANMAKHCVQMMQHFLAQASMSDANQNYGSEAPATGWLKARQ